MDTRIKVLHVNEPMIIRIRPWHFADTKVIIKKALQQSGAREYLIEGKDYKGTLQMEHAIFRDEVLNWNLELGYHGHPFRDG